MTLHGTLSQGMILLDHPLTLPEGTRVEVVLTPIASPDGKPTGKPTFLDMLEFAGCMPDMPADFAAQHDHYIHGMPKK
jgi:hypothetical protein